MKSLMIINQMINQMINNKNTLKASIMSLFLKKVKIQENIYKYWYIDVPVMRAFFKKIKYECCFERYSCLVK